MGQIQVKAPANGRVHRAEIYVLGDNGKVTFNDKADLMAVQELTKAARRLAPHVGKEPKEVEKELADLWHQALDQQRREEQARQEEAAAAATAPAKVDEGARAAALLAGMPPDVRDEAAARLRSGDLLKTVMDDIERLGVAGERPLAIALYLTGVSRLLTRPLAVRVKGPSSSGKSYVIRSVSALFPPEVVIHATQMTPQALYHMPPGGLRHRWVVAGERSRREDDDTADATRALREMLSEGRLDNIMPMKVGGEIVTQRIEQEGPIAYVESTTLTAVFDEDENRCLSFFTDEREEQTRRIIDRLAEDHAGVRDAGETGRL